MKMPLKKAPVCSSPSQERYVKDICLILSHPNAYVSEKNMLLRACENLFYADFYIDNDSILDIIQL